jgi:hypothetical protein
MEAKLDCGDNSCEFAETKTGMRTNGGCRCLKDLDFSRRMAVRGYIKALREENDRLRGEIERLQPIAAWESAWQEGKDDAAVFARERDEARAEVARLEEELALEKELTDLHAGGATHAENEVLRLEGLIADVDMEAGRSVYAEHWIAFQAEQRRIRARREEGPKYVTAEQFSLSTAEEERNYFTGETAGVPSAFGFEAAIPDGQYRVLNGALYRVMAGLPPSLAIPGKSYERPAFSADPEEPLSNF